MDRTLKNLQKRLERLELEHLRQHALELNERLEQAEDEARRANESADFWQRNAMELLEALHDGEFATHRCIGLTKSGELIVARTDGQ